jgi:hypothetical protein
MVAAALLAVASEPEQVAAAEHVDLRLVLAVDVSRSMASLGDLKQKLQRNGYVDAFKSSEVQKAILSGPYGKIAVTYVEWSSAFYQQTVVPWRIIASDEDALVFADDLARAPISLDQSTSISGGLLYSLTVLERSGIDSDRSAIDVSGDGPNNNGAQVAPIREQVLRAGMVINGLPIILDPTPVYGGSLADYYEDCVIGGPGAFFITVTDVREFQSAIRRKLVLEIAAANPLPQAVPVQDTLASRPKMNCLLAETIRPPRP